MGLEGISSDMGIDSRTMLLILQKVTYVTKTRKAYGFHIYWLSRKQNPSIPNHKYNFKSGFESEIKTGKQMCTLPHSTRREDSEFHYCAIGRTDKLLVSDEFYDIILELLGDCFIREAQIGQSNENQNQAKAKYNNHKTNFSSLSPEIIQISVDYLSPYAIKNHRNDFALGFGETTFHSRISQESAATILEGICDKTRDEEKRNRLETLHSTYERGLAGEPVTGGPTLAELIMQVKNYDNVTANKIVDTLKGFWREDVRKQKVGSETLVELSITKAKREKEGFVKVRGKIIGISPVYNMIKSIDVQCTVCKYNERITYPNPKFKSHIKERSKCPNSADDGHSSGNTVVTNYEYLSTLDVSYEEMTISKIS
jgi:hypothetical protein